MPTTPTDADGHGLLVVHEPEGQINLDIVAVHGLNGKRWSTWTDGEAMWLRDFLPGKIKDARIMTFGYDANVINNLSTLDVRGHANKLLSRLRNRRDDPPVEERPIVFICHSLGGIVVKQALRLAHNDPAYSDIAKSTKGIVFLGTPHRGSGMADWAGLLANVVRVSVFVKVKKDLLKILANDSEELLRISEDFRTIVNNYNITSFYEEDKLKGVDRAVVPRHSAIMEIPGEDAMPLDGNHMEICRFRSADSEQFELVWKAVRRVSGLTAIQADLSPIVASLSELQFGALPDRTLLPLPGTFSWFGGHSDVISWLNNPSTPFMHITGKHGSGKTFLSSYMYHTLTQAGLKCVYLPCTALVGDKNTKTIARNLIGGLLYAEPAYADIMYPRTSTSDRQLHSLSEAEMLAELGRLLDLLKSKRLVIILDGADDVGEDLPTLIDALQGVWAGSALRLAFLSRPRTDLLSDQDKRVHLDLDTVLESSQDIDLYVAAMVELIIKRRPGMANHKDGIIASLKKRADGMFLLVTLLSQKVLTLKLSSARRIREQLASLPESLTDAYEDRLAMVEESDRSWVKSTLLWLRYGRRRLVGTELAIAVASLPHIGESTTTKAHEDEDWVDDIACDFLIDLTHSLGSLVTMASDRSIGFSHGTVSEFLATAPPSFWYAVSEEEATAALIGSSLRILRYSSRQKESPVEQAQALTPRKQNFLVMAVFAAESLPDLVREVRRDAPIMAEVCNFMNDEELFSKWQRVYWHLFDPDRTPMPSPFHIAGVLDLHELMHALLQRLSQPEQDRLLNKSGHEAQSILDCCAEGGASELIKSLIKLGANPNSHYKENRTVLSTAAWYGQMEAIKVLVANGAKLDAVDYRGRSALDVAAESGRNTAITALLDLGASMNNSIWPSPLVAAIENNRIATMELLIDRGANVNHIATDGYTPARNASALHAAVYNGRPTIVKRLLGLGADVNLNSHQDLVKPLHLAAQVADTVSMGDLLAAGADPVANTRRGQTPLDWLIIGKMATQSEDSLHQSSRRNMFDQLFSLTDATFSEDQKVEAYLAIMQLVFENQSRIILEHIIASYPQIVSNQSRLYKEVIIKVGKPPLLEPMTEGLLGLKAEAHSLQLATEAAHNPDALAWLCQAFGEDPVKSTDADGRTGLHRVVLGAPENKPGLARAYITAGADPMQRDQAGQSPFSIVLALNKHDYQRSQLLSTFVTAGARLTPAELQDLLEPSRGNDTVYTKALIDICDPKTFDMEAYRDYPDALHSFFIVALETKRELWLEKVRSACDAEAYERHIWQELVRHAAKAITWTIEASLDRLLSQPELNVSHKDDEGNTAMHLFAKTGADKVLERLIALGADKNAINNAGRDPRKEALRAGKFDTAMKLS